MRGYGDQIQKDGERELLIKEEDEELWVSFAAQKKEVEDLQAGFTS